MAIERQHTSVRGCTALIVCIPFMALFSWLIQGESCGRCIILLIELSRQEWCASGCLQERIQDIIQE